MVKIAVFFKQKGEESYPLNKDYFRSSYKQLNQLVESLGHELLIVRHEDSYLGAGKFNEAWKLVGNEVKSVGPVEVDVVYNKGRFPFDDVPVFGGKELEKLAVDKQAVHNLLPDLSPKSFLVNTEDEYRKCFSEEFGTNVDELIVVKPNTGASGRQVEIKTAKEHLETVPENINEGFVIQEFLDNTGGVEGVTPGAHDIRIILFNGELQYGVVRIPAEGSLLTNFMQGATRRVLVPDDVPADFLAFAKKIDEIAFASVEDNRLLAIDCMLTPKGLRLVEVNNSVGLDVWEDENDPTYGLHCKLVEVLVSMANNNK